MEDFNEDEFEDFDREKLNRLFREKMQDDDFRKRFMGVIGGYQRDYEGIMKLLWGMNANPFNDPFSGLSFNPDKNSFFKGLDFNSLNENDWEGGNWSSEDGETHISSFSRSFTPEEFYNSEKMQNQMNDGELPTEYVIELLSNKLGEAIDDENYEEAASLRDTIKSLNESSFKDDKKTK
jgi:hypothetical protein